MLFDCGAAIGAGSVIAFNDCDVIACEQRCRGNAGSHDAAANDTDLMERVGCYALEFGQFGNRALGKEDVPKCLGLIAVAQFDEFFTFKGKACIRAFIYPGSE